MLIDILTIIEIYFTSICIYVYICKFTHDGGDDDGGGGDPFFVMSMKNSVLIWDYQYFH